MSVNFWSIKEELLSNGHVIGNFLKELVIASGMTPLEHTLHVEHLPILPDQEGECSSGYGISAGMILIESYIYIHTWPEFGYARLELSGCKAIDMDSVFNYLKKSCGEGARIECKLVNWE